MATGKPKKAFSRIKYEQNHPTVSFRVSKELYDRLEEVKKAEDKSNTDVLKVGMGLLAVKVSHEKEARRQRYEEGLKKGYEKAESLYSVTYPCKVCREITTVTSAQEKEAIKGYMHANEWGHTDCINRRC